MPPKADAAEIRRFIDSLAERFPFQDAGRRRWHGTLYRYDDVRSIAKILISDSLYSRQKCINEGIAFHDAANSGIIDQTQHLHPYARLFYRPRSPTQYRNEGIRPRAEVEAAEGHPHCPVPVFLLFDAKLVMAMDTTTFTNGSPTRGECVYGTDAAFLRTIPFEWIYHDGAFTQDQKSAVIFHRQAEILVRDELPLTPALKEVVCRTAPERDTLLDLLGDQADRWEEGIRVEHPDERLFFKSHLFVEAVTAIPGQLRFDFHPRSGLYTTHIVVRDVDTGEILVDSVRENRTIDRVGVCPIPDGAQRVHITLHIDDALAFRGVRAQSRLYL